MAAAHHTHCAGLLCCALPHQVHDLPGCCAALSGCPLAKGQPCYLLLLPCAVSCSCPLYKMCIWTSATDLHAAVSAIVHALIKFVHEAMYVSACSSYNISTRIYHHVRTRQCGTDLCFLAAKIPLSTISARKARFILVTKAVMTSKHCFSLNEAELGYIAV